MKKIIKIAFSLILAVSLFTACQSTPEKPVVIQKDMEQMIKKAKATDTAQKTKEPAQNALAKRLGVPERFAEKGNYSEGRLKLAADAEIELPEADSVPVARVEPADFPQDMVNMFYDYLIGDTPMYQQQRVFTKSQIQEEIVSWKRTMNDPRDGENSINQAEQEIKNLEALYASALDTPALIPADSAIKQQSEIDSTTGKTLSVYSGVDIAENPGLRVNKGKTFSIKNNTKNGEIIIKEDGFSATNVIDTASQGARFYYCNYDLIKRDASPEAQALEIPGACAEALVETVTPREITDLPEKFNGISYKAALDMAQDFLDNAGISDMKAAELKLKIMLPGKYIDQTAEPAQNAAFTRDVLKGEYDKEIIDTNIEISLVRMINGVQVTSGESSSYIGDPMYGAQWFYEQLTIGACKDGIYSVSWISPNKITETVTEDSNLLSFNEIADVFDKMYRVTYDASGTSSSGEVKRVTLSLRRIMDQNKIGYGLFVPVWDFYGTMSVSFTDYPDEPPRELISDAPLLTINAINGSVIDLDKGY